MLYGILVNFSGWFVLCLVWCLLAWPLWDRAFVIHKCDPVAIMPFALGMIGLLPPSFEQQVQNRLFGVILSLSSSLLAFATLISREQLTDGNLIVISVITLILTLNSMFTPYAFGHQKILDRAAYVKLISIAGISLGIAWGNSFWIGISSEILASQMLFCVSFLACSAGEIYSQRLCRFGDGTIFFWLSLRCFCCPGVPLFYIWGGFSLMVYLISNIHLGKEFYAYKKGEDSFGMAAYYDVFLKTGCTLSSWIFTISAIALIVSSSGSLLETKGNWLRTINLQGDNCSEIETFLVSQMVRPFQDYSKTHYIYENSGSLINAMLLLGNSAFLYIHDNRKTAVSGRMWQALFFFIALLSTIYYERSETEFVLNVVGELTTHWSRDSYAMFGMCGVGFLLCVVPIHKWHMVERMNLASVPLLIGSSCIIIAMICSLLGAWPQTEMVHNLINLPKNNTIGCFQKGSNTMEYIHSQSMISFSVDYLLADDFMIMFVAEIVSLIVILMGTWDKTISDIGLLINLGNGIFLSTFVVRLFSEIQEFSVDGSLYHPYIATLSFLVISTLLFGTVMRLREPNYSACTPEELGWENLSEFQLDWATSGQDFLTLEDFVKTRTKVDITDKQYTIGDPDTAYWRWRSMIECEALRESE